MEIMDNIGKLWLKVQLTWRLLNDSRVPFWTKGIPVLAFLYLFSPIDLLPDFFLVLGQFDDLVILMGGMELFERLAPPFVVEQYKLELGLEEIDSMQDTELTQGQ